MTKKHHTKEKAGSERQTAPEGMDAAMFAADTLNSVGAPMGTAAEETEKKETMETQATTEVETQDSALITELETKLSEMEAAKEDSYNRMLRIQADFDNFRRRSRQEYEQACLYGGEDLIKKILPVLDSLERAVAAFNEKSADNCSWQEGVRLTLKQFQNILTAEGLEAVEALNRVFDPQVHEAVFQEQSDTVSEPTVREELQKGYKYKNKLIRPALVKVAVP
jgi:molecular chaperone GrpE